MALTYNIYGIYNDEWEWNKSEKLCIAEIPWSSGENRKSLCHVETVSKNDIPRIANIQYQYSFAMIRM